MGTLQKLNQSWTMQNVQLNLVDTVANSKQYSQGFLDTRISNPKCSLKQMSISQEQVTC